MTQAEQQRPKRSVFRIEHMRGRWMLVMPDGKPFISMGVTHLEAAISRDPSRQDRSAAVERITTSLRAWRFNTAGYHHPAEIRDRIPFIADTFLAWIPYFVPQPRYIDVFGGYRSVARRIVHRMCAAVKGNLNLIGYYWTDTPRWDLDTARKLTGDDWVSFIRREPPAFPGKQQYVAFLRDRYRNDVQEFIAAYHLPFDEKAMLASDFAALALEHPRVHRDDYDFLRLIARAYYHAAGEAMEREDRKHLVFGDRYMLNDLPDEVLEEALPWIDAIAVQPFHAQFEKERFDHIYRIARKPILICDHAINFPTARYPHTGWERVANETDAVRAYDRYLREAFATPYVIGYHRCHYADRYVRDRGILMQGLTRDDGSPYATLIEGVSQANGAILEEYGGSARGAV